MGSELLTTFNFERNAFEGNPRESAYSAIRLIQKAVAKEDLSKGERNRVNSLASYIGLLRKEGDGWNLTNVGKLFLSLSEESPPDAWRWAVTRALWKYAIPNGTNCRANKAGEATRENPSRFFWQICSLTAMLSGLPEEERWLYYQEVCELYNQPDAWTSSAASLFQQLLYNRSARFPPDPARKFLDDLEPEYNISRDNFNGTFGKAFQQTGLFEYKQITHNSSVAIALDPDLGQVLRRRLRFVIDNPPCWPNGTEWSDYLGADSDGFPIAVESETESTAPLHSHVREAIGATLPKAFILLAGISGTGKSRFVIEQAKVGKKGSSNQSASNYCLIPVRPDWHEPADLLGYKSRIGGERYVATDFLRFVVTAWLDSIDDEGNERPLIDTTPHWLCLDEMNLAPVEQYFADFLSALETRRFDGETYCCDPILRASEIRSLSEEARADLKRHLFEDDICEVKRDKLFKRFTEDTSWGGIPIPPNLIVAGTVNMDETTHGFSRKVIDRALTLDFQEFYPNEFDRYWHDNQIRPIGLSFPFAYDSRDRSVRAALGATADTDGLRTVALLNALNHSLRESPFELAYRALNEALLSVACFAQPKHLSRDKGGSDKQSNALDEHAEVAPVDAEAAPTGDDASAELMLFAAWDDYIMQKVLPRIEGDGAKLAALREIGTPAIQLPGEFGRGSILHQLYSLLSLYLSPIWGPESEEEYDATNATATRPDLLRQIDEVVVIPCRSRRKLRWMMRRLKASHFTDFWC